MAAYWSDDPQVKDTASLDSHGGKREEGGMLSVANPSDCDDSTDSEYEEDFQCSSRLSSSRTLAYHGSCPNECKRRLFTGVIHHCLKDDEWAGEVQMWLEQQELTYHDGKFPVRIALLGDVTHETGLESFDEICENRMTTVFIILHTTDYENDHSCWKLGLKIINTVPNYQSFVAIELFRDETLMERNKRNYTQRLLFRPNQSTFREKIRDVLKGKSFHEEIQHNEERRKCEEKRRTDLQRFCTRNKKNRKTSHTKGSQRNAQESTTESDSLVFPRQTSSAKLRDQWRDSRSSLTEHRSSCHTSLPKDDGTIQLKQRLDLKNLKDSRSNVKASKPGTLQQPTGTEISCDTGNRASSQHTSGKRTSYQTDKIALQLDRADPEQADDQHKTYHCLTWNQANSSQAESLNLSNDSYSSDHTRKHQISHFLKKSAKSPKQNLPSKSSTDLSEASSSSASERFSGNREIKHGPLHQKHDVEQENNEKELSDHQNTCSLRSLPCHQSPGGTSHGRDSEGTSHYKQYPPRLPGKSSTKPMAVVPPTPQNPSNYEEDEDDSEQTVRKTLYTVQETPNISSGSSSTYDNCEGSLQQPLPTTQVSVAMDNSQPNSAASSSGDFETEEPLEANSVPAVETLTTDNEAEGGESGRQRPIPRLLSRFLSPRLLSPSGPDNRLRPVHAARSYRTGHVPHKND